MQLLKEKVMKRRRLTKVLFILGGLILAFVTFSTPSGWALDQVSLRLDWIGYTPHHIAFWIAKEKGWFAQEGIDVTIGSGRGSVQTAQLLISKKDPIGYMTGVTGAVSRQRGTAPDGRCLPAQSPSFLQVPEEVGNSNSQGSGRANCRPGDGWDSKLH